MTPCPYRGCKGEYGHGSPHLFEAPQIERFEAEATAAAEQRLQSLEMLGRAAMEHSHNKTDTCTPTSGCAIAAFKAALDSAPPPASPRQGEPVAGEGENRAVQIILDARCRCGKVSASEIMTALLPPPYASTDPAEPVAPDKEAS